MHTYTQTDTCINIYHDATVVGVVGDGAGEGTSLLLVAVQCSVLITAACGTKRMLGLMGFGDPVAR